MEMVREKLESLFEVRQTKYTGARIFLTFCLIVFMAASLPLYFRYEEYVHGNYANDYNTVRQWVADYKETVGEYPLGGPVSLEQEKDLRIFFEQNHLNPNRALFYLSEEALPGLSEMKYTYLIDRDHGTLFTAEYVIYDMRRMHIPGYTGN